MPGLPPRFTKLDFRLGIRLSASAVLAMVLGRMLGLHAFYWAGISAIIVSTGSPGGSFSASHLSWRFRRIPTRFWRSAKKPR